jgi:two-component sensor histidine kinase
MMLTPRRVFILLGVLAAVAIILFRGQALIAERERVLEQSETQVGSMAEATASYAARIYDSSGRLAQEVSDFVRRENPGPEAIRSFIASETAGSALDDYAVVLDEAGRMIAFSEGDVPPAGIEYGSPTYEAYVRDANRQIEPVMLSRVSGGPIYSLTTNLVDSTGRFRGVVGVNFQPEGLRRTSERGPGDPMLSLWTTDGGFIAASFVDFGPDGRAIPPPKPPGLGIPGSDLERDPRQVAGAVSVDGWPLIAVASYEKEGLLAEWRRHTWENAAVIAVSLFGLSGLVWLGVRTADREEMAKQGFQEATAIAEEALKDRELLLREVHHRVKNSLLMTSSLLHLQARQFTAPTVRAAFESTGQRLTSIGLVHDALYSGSDIQKVDLSVYLPKLLHEIAHAHGADARGVIMNIQIDTIDLLPDRATPTGLILTEVVTNAFKHAFPDERGGEIIVRCSLSPHDEIDLTIHDDGKGYADTSGLSPSGLGTKLIRALTEQLGGRMSFSSQGGAVFRMTFPRSGGPIPAEAEGRPTPNDRKRVKTKGR